MPFVVEIVEWRKDSVRVPSRVPNGIPISFFFCFCGAGFLGSVKVVDIKLTL